MINSLRSSPHTRFLIYIIGLVTLTFTLIFALESKTFGFWGWHSLAATVAIAIFIPHKHRPIGTLAALSMLIYLNLGTDNTSLFIGILLATSTIMSLIHVIKQKKWSSTAITAMLALTIFFYIIGGKFGAYELTWMNFSFLCPALLLSITYHLHLLRRGM